MAYFACMWCVDSSLTARNRFTYIFQHCFIYIDTYRDIFLFLVVACNPSYVK